MRHSFLNIFIAFFLAMTVSMVDAGGNFIKAQGGQFVDSSGTKVIFRGMGLGGWLVPEGYMLHIPGFGSPTAIRQKITDLIGDTNTEAFYEKYEANYVNETDIKRLAEMGFNSIRLPFNYRSLSPVDQPGVYLEEGFAQIDSLVVWCKRNKMWVILDMHCAPGGQNPGEISDSDGTARLWLDENNKTRTVDIWRKIAQRYANEPTIAGYDLLNEPVLPTGVDASALRGLYIDITRAIREVDTNHIVYIEGNWYASDFTKLTPPWDANMSYNFHKYWSDTDQSTIEYMLNIRQNFGMPLWMSESGENSNPWYHSQIKVFEKNEVSWCWWTHKKIATITSPYSAEIKPGYQTLLDYWNGNGQKPTVDFAVNALDEMADGLKLENCTWLPDVEAALFDTLFDVQSRPYSELKIPGVIPTAHYDIGTEGLAYHDADYEKTRWDADMPWNRGYQYRNDGVDLQESSDAGGSPFSVSFIEANEWLLYTVNVEHSDTFDVVFRVASGGTGGQLRLLIDNKVLLNGVAISPTGGWYDWEDVRVNDIYLEQGNRQLELLFTSSGFNINQIEFIAHNTGTGPGEVPNQLYLGQNYPNPFNGVTTIPFEIQKENASGNLRIYNVRGQLLRKIALTPEQSATQRVEWDGTDGDGNVVASGIYYYELTSGNRSRVRKLVFQR